MSNVSDRTSAKLLRASLLSFFSRFNGQMSTEVKDAATGSTRNYYKKPNKKQNPDRLFDTKQKEGCWAQAAKVPGLY